MGSFAVLFVKCSSVPGLDVVFCSNALLSFDLDSSASFSSAKQAALHLLYKQKKENMVTV